MNHEEAIRKAMACLRLAKSSNPNEAAFAAAKAQEIITRYQLDVSAVDFDAGQVAQDKEPIMDFGEDAVDNVNNHMRWCVALAGSIARANQCRTVFATTAVSGYRIRIIGRPSDVAGVRYLYAYLKSAVVKLKLEHCKGHSNTFARQFCLGAVDSIKIKLNEQVQATIVKIKGEAAVAGGLSLVKVNAAVVRLDRRAQEVDDFILKNIVTGKSSSGRTHTNIGLNARHLGQIAGRDIQISRARGSIGN